MRLPKQPFRRSKRREAILLLYIGLLALSHTVRWFSSPAGALLPGQKRILLQEGQSTLIAYRDIQPPAGSANQPVLVMIHGSPVASRSMNKLIPLLSDRYRLIIPDLPGFGGSSRVIENYSVRQLARDVLKLLAVLDLDKANFFGYSRGGAVILNIADQAPEKVQSLILGSAIGVEEYALFGNYSVNRAIYAIQWGVLWLLEEGFPHFGLLDFTLLDVPYARNFLDSDLRPNRRILKHLQAPILILHGREDKLVPYAAGLEHHRLAPQSEMTTLPGGHMLIFKRPALLAGPIRNFLDRVERKSATTRAMVEPLRILRSEQPFDYGTIPPAAAFTLLAAVGLLIAGSWIAPFFATLAGGLLCANGVIGFIPASMACLGGVLTRDLSLFFLGRGGGWKSPQRRPLRILMEERMVTLAGSWMRGEGAPFLIRAPLYPGVRDAAIFAAGAAGREMRKFLLFTSGASLFWSGGIYLFALLTGRGVLLGLSNSHRSNAGWLSIFGILLYGFFKLGLPLLTFRGRRLLLSLWRRKRRWEFWPMWKIYTPLIPYLLYLGLKYRSLTLPAAANPTMPSGGIIGEKKTAILRGLSGSKEFLARWVSLENTSDIESRMAALEAFLLENEIDYPVCLKPDEGQRGLGVRIVHNGEEARRYFQRAIVDSILQECLAGREYGVFYYRYPNADEGHVFSITEKRLLHLKGDGKKTLEELILEDDRAVCMAPFFLHLHRDRIFEVPEEGETVPITEIGTHSKGALFLDGNHLLTPALSLLMDEISKPYEGFYFGRYDLIAPSEDDFRRGRRLKVIELNGTTSEATHIYDPGHSFLYALRTLMKQWRIAFEIGSLNRACGKAPVSLRFLWGHFRETAARQRKIEREFLGLAFQPASEVEAKKTRVFRGENVERMNSIPMNS